MRRIATSTLVALLACSAAHAAAQPNGMVILLTDYGHDSIYVGALKGAIYTKFPGAKIDSITNSVPAYDIATGAYMLLELCAEFPPGTVFCCVVDPGVGTPRKNIVLETKRGQIFVAPDNGLLDLVARRDGIADLREATNQALWRNGAMSHTFHGRDIYAPVAASLASGIPVEQSGVKLKTMVELNFPESTVSNGIAKGEVIRRDPYGNLVTNLTPDDLAAIGAKAGDTLAIEIGDATYTAPLKNTYSDVRQGNRLVLIQSMGRVECAINQGSLADELGQGLHAPVSLRVAP